MSNEHSNLVSIIIPTHNRAGLLQEAVRSVFDQSYRPLECIIVDDGSIDETAIIAEQLIKTYQRTDFTFKYFYQTQSGAPAARNLGTTNATGEFIQYLDSDDLLYPEKLMEQVTFLRNNETYEAVFGDWNSGLPDAFMNIKGYVSADMVTQLLTLERSIANFSILMRRSLVQRIGLWDTQLRRCQEIDFHLRGLLAGAVYHYQAFTTGLWRYHESERIHNQTGLDAFAGFYQKWEAILKERNLFTQEMAEKIADWYMWFLAQSKQQQPEKLLLVLHEAVRLKPSLTFYNSFKMRLLRFLLGQKVALKLWLTRYLQTA